MSSLPAGSFFFGHAGRVAITSAATTAQRRQPGRKVIMTGRRCRRDGIFVARLLHYHRWAGSLLVWFRSVIVMLFVSAGRQQTSWTTITVRYWRRCDANQFGIGLPSMALIGVVKLDEWWWTGLFHSFQQSVCWTCSWLRELVVEAISSHLTHWFKSRIEINVDVCFCLDSSGLKNAAGQWIWLHCHAMCR